MAKPEILKLHGNDIAFRQAGPADGETILLIHGMAGSSDTWRDVMPNLAKDHRVIAIDLPGHGKSGKAPGDYSLGSHANILRDLLSVLDSGPVTVVGQSLGGGIAMQLAYQHPELCGRLVLVSSGGLGREVNWKLRAMAAPGSELVLRVVAPWFVLDAGNSVRRFIGSHGMRAARAEEMWRAYASLGDADTRQAFLRTLRAVVDTGGQAVSARDKLYLTEAVPTMLVWGDADQIIPVSHAYEAHEAMPASRLEILPGAGHFPQVERPAMVIDALRDFVATTVPASLNASEFSQIISSKPE